MRRRKLLAGLGALGLVGAGAVGARTDVLSDGEEPEQIEPVDLRRFDAPGSPPGTETVPEPGRVTFLEMFATWCGICKRKMGPLGTAHAEVGEDVQFVSVTSEPIGRSVQPEDVVEWFADLGGNWPVASDEDLDLSRRVDATAVPYAVVFDEQNRITSTSTGYAEAGRLIERIENAK